jgi:hypothetical protein
MTEVISDTTKEVLSPKATLQGCNANRPDRGGAAIGDAIPSSHVDEVLIKGNLVSIQTCDSSVLFRWDKHMQTSSNPSQTVVSSGSDCAPTDAVH